MAVADRHDLPIADGIASGQRNEQKLVVETLKARFVEPLPEKLIEVPRCVLGTSPRRSGRAADYSSL
jgi:hypothetical protein